MKKEENCILCFSRWHLLSWVQGWTRAPGVRFRAFGQQGLPALKEPEQGQTVPATRVLGNVHVLFLKDKQEKYCLSLGVTQIGQMESCHFAYTVIHNPSLGFSSSFLEPQTAKLCSSADSPHTARAIHWALCWHFVQLLRGVTQDLVNISLVKILVSNHKSKSYIKGI